MLIGNSGVKDVNKMCDGGVVVSIASYSSGCIGIMVICLQENNRIFICEVIAQAGIMLKL
jgi:hypothetical protein